MIFLAGIPSEGPLRWVLSEAEEAGIEALLFNQRDAFFTSMASTATESWIRIRDTLYSMDGFEGAYLRLMDHHHLPGHDSKDLLAADRTSVRRSDSLHELLMTWADTASCRIMNRGRNMASNLSKPYQTQLIESVGFRAPATLITNSRKALNEFRGRYPRVVYKSISSLRSIVRELEGHRLPALENLRYLPTQFQAYIPGTNIRVHVVGDALFATRIYSRAVDYRYASLENQEVAMEAMQLAPEVEERCFALSRLLELPLCGIDLKQTPEGDYYCFEVNPSPGYSYYQENTGQNIARAIVHYLEYGTAKESICRSSKTGPTFVARC